jgi:prepilin-type N-terminal cleavage/methylation domain-containing protein
VLNKKTHAKAFSLIEVIIAIALAGIAFTVLTQTFVNILYTLDSLESQSDREKHIRFVRSQIIMIDDRDEFEEGETITTLEFGEAEWEAEITETAVVDLFKADVRIKFENPDGEPFMWEETLFLLRPTWSDPIERSALLTEIKTDLDDADRQRDW